MMTQQIMRVDKQRMFLLFSITFNLIALIIVLIYLFTPMLDLIVVKKSGQRMCKTYTQAFQTQKGKEFCNSIVNE